MPIIKLDTEQLWIAFALSAMFSALTMIIALYVKGIYTESTISDKNTKQTIKQELSPKAAMITFFITFLAYFLGYVIMYVIFGLKK